MTRNYTMECIPFLYTNVIITVRPTKIPTDARPITTTIIEYPPLCAEWSEDPKTQASILYVERRYNHFLKI
jgi:hypothetical protein